LSRNGVLTAISAVAALLLVSHTARAQIGQRADSEYRYENRTPAFAKESGPLVAFSRHNSPFVQQGSHEPLAALARGDGFRVAIIDGSNPGEAPIFALINNYLKSFRDHSPMEPPSAFSPAEIETIRGWVEAGGSLLILADHAPLGGGASALAAAFGFTILNGHAAEEREAQGGRARTDIEYRRGGDLTDNHAVTNGATGRKVIDRFFAFGGQAFIPPAGATTLLRIPQGWSAIFSFGLEPAALREAPRIDASGMAQGAVMDYGKGRIAVFAEAGGFSAQFGRGGRAHGFNTPQGADNPEFVLAVLRWLVRYEPQGK
jgi:hypothetical protein